MEIVQLSLIEAQAALPALAALLQDAVADGASVGYLPPLSTADAEGYWQGVLAKLPNPQHVLLVAHVADRIVGTVQLVGEQRPNGSHRAEISKLLVHTAARGQGIATALMHAVEAAAHRNGRSLLVLDTLTDSLAERLYHRLGYQMTGIVPGYARDGDGVLQPCTFMHTLLEAAVER